MHRDAARRGAAPVGLAGSRPRRGRAIGSNRRASGVTPWVIGLTLAAGCGDRPGPPALTTLALAGPPGGEPVFESHAAIDPSDPDRVVVAAHYGAGYNRGGRRIWSWHTEDGGRHWVGADQPLPDPRAALAADAVAAFDGDGTAYLIFLFADTTGRAFDGGAALARTAPGSLAFGPAMPFVRGGLNVAGAAVDKGWIALDRGATSPLAGSLYLTWHLNRPDFEAGTVSSTLWLARKRDPGSALSEPLKVADGFSGQVGVRSTGTVDVIYTTPGERAIVHASSSDGGLTFDTRDTVATFEPGTAVDIPHLLVTPGDSLLICWAAARGTDSTRYATECARSAGTGRWEAPRAVVPDLPGGTSIGFPTTAANRAGIWLLAYRGDADTTRVVLYRSTDGGATFEPAHELARRAIGRAAFCLAARAPCRSAESGAFFPGDYFGLAATDERIVAAYVLPETDRADGPSAVYVSLVRP